MNKKLTWIVHWTSATASFRNKITNFEHPYSLKPLPPFLCTTLCFYHHPFTHFIIKAHIEYSPTIQFHPFRPFTTLLLLFSRNYSFSHYITLPSTLNQFTVIKFDFNTSPPKQCSIFSKYNHSLYPHSKNVITNQQLFSTSKSHNKPIDLSSHIHTRFLNHKSILFIVLATRIGSFLSRFYHNLYFLFI